MSDHDRAHIGGDRLPEWGKLDGVQPGAVMGHNRQGDVRVVAGVAMAGEVLGGGQHAAGL